VVDDHQWGVLRTVHERFAQRIAAALSTKLRCRVDAKLVGVDQLSYGELLRGIDRPTCIAVLAAPPHEGELGLDVQHGILLAIIDRQLGGGREPAPPVRRPLTAIEQRLAARVVRALADELHAAWRGVADFELAVGRVEHDPQAARIAPSSETVVRVRVELVIGAARGCVTVGLPGGFLRSIDRKHLNRPAVSGGEPTASHDRTAPSTVTVIAQLARARVAKSDLDKLQVGDIITTEQDVRSRLSVCVDGVPKFLARAGVAEGRKAVQIDDLISDPGVDPR
jgi:flagellar motor switch protein FliM